MRDPYRKKQRDLRRIARSGRNSIWSLFDDYCPEYKKYDEGSCRLEWHVYYDAQWEWVHCIRGGNFSVIEINSVHRRDENRKLRIRQKSALNKAFREDDWDGFNFPCGRRNIRWLYW